MRVRVVLTVGVLVLAMAGCATQADIQALNREQRRLSSRMADTRASLEAMERQMAKLRGQIDEVRHAGGAPGRSSRVEDLESRVALLESDGRPPMDLGQDPAAADAAEAAEGLTPPAEEDDGDAASGEAVASVAPDAPEEYRKGMAAVEAREYDRAIQNFRSFLRTNGDSPLAPNAHYWIGDSYFQLGDYYQAILNFNDVRQRYATSDRAPASVLKIGLAFLKMGNKTEARLAFQKVVQDYPSSPEATKAKEQLRSLS